MNLENNQLTSLPVSLGNLNKLHKLLLTQNQLAIVPGFFKNLTNLEKVDLSNQTISLLPKDFTTQTFTLTSSIKAMGEIVPPNGGIRKYVINGNDITWTNLTKDTKFVEFTFEELVKIGGVKSEFLGTVKQSLNYRESISHTLSFNLNGSSRIIPENQIIQTEI